MTVIKLFDHIQFEDVARMPKPGGQIPQSIQFASDGQTVYYLLPADGVSMSLWAYDVRTQEHFIVADPPTMSGQDTFDEEMRRQRLRSTWTGITQYQWQGEVLLVPLHGQLYVKRGEGPLAPLPGVEGVLDARLSHDSRWIYGVIDQNLYRIDSVTGALTALTDSGREALSYGLAEYVAQEEFNRSRGYWVSPNDRWIAYAEVDERHMTRYPIVHWDQETISLEEHRYPFVGQENARVRLGIAPLDQSAFVHWIDWGPQERYLIDVLWSTDDNLRVLTLARDHKHLAWDCFDAAGRHQSRVYEETAEKWINPPSSSRLLSDGRIVSSTEREGLRQLLVISPGKEDLLVTPEGEREGAVLDILHVDEVMHRAYVWATRRRARERTVIRIDWHTGGWEDLTTEPGWHRAVIDPGGFGLVDQWSDFDRAPITRYYHLAHRTSSVIHQNAVSREELGLHRPDFFEMTVEDGTVLNGLLYRPHGERPIKGWPLVVSVYAGPHAQMVFNGWDETMDLQAQYLAQQGYLVMKLDSRGSFYRGPAFEQVLYRQFGQVELQDQIAGVYEVSRQETVDLARVGIYGWSYGGYMTLRALLFAPDIFRVGVAGAPVTDFRWYDTAYTERYLGTDQNNHPGYEDTALWQKARDLKGHLLLIHGMVDENVHFRHSARLIQAFIDAGRDFDLIVFPNSRHMVQGGATILYRTRRTLQYIEQHL